MTDLGATKRTMSLSVPFITTTPTPQPIISAPSWFVDYAIYGPYTATTTVSASESASIDAPGSTIELFSKEAIAGVVVGVLVGIAVIVCFLLFWLRKRRQKRAGGMAMVLEPYPTNLGHPHQGSAPVLGVPGASVASFSARNPQSPVQSGSVSGRAVREVDGGVRLATSTTAGSDIVVLPPRYEPYDRAPL